jgi:hypothetical protein
MITQKTTTVLKRMKYNQIIFSVQNVAYVTIIHRHAILEYDGLNSTDDCLPVYKSSGSILWALSMAGFKEVSMENFVPVFRSCE